MFVQTPSERVQFRGVRGQLDDGQQLGVRLSEVVHDHQREPR